MDPVTGSALPGLLSGAEVVLIGGLWLSNGLSISAAGMWFDARVSCCGWSPKNSVDVELFSVPGSPWSAGSSCEDRSLCDSADE